MENNTRRSIKASQLTGLKWPKKALDGYRSIALPVRRTLIFIVAIIGLALIILFLPISGFSLALTVCLNLAFAFCVNYLWPGVRITLLALAGFALLTVALYSSNELKISVTSFRITSIDLQMLVVNPSGVLFSIGAPGWAHTALKVALGFAVMPIVFGMYRLARGQSFRHVIRVLSLTALRMAMIAVAFLGLNMATVKSVSAYLDKHILELEVWQPEGMVQFSRAAGTIGFLAYSRHIEATERDNFFEYQPSSPPPDWRDIRASVAKIIDVDSLKPGLMPNIIIVHAESIFDPNDVLNLEFPVENPLFYSDGKELLNDHVHAHGPALVNTIGGGSWATEFEVITGMDTRLFGVSGRFTHASLSRYAKRTFPRYLRERGYSVTGFMNSDGSFYNYQNGYTNYGFNRFLDQKYFDLSVVK